MKNDKYVISNRTLADKRWVMVRLLVMVVVVGILFVGCAGTYIPAQSSSSRSAAKTDGCGGKFVQISDWSSGFMSLQYTSKACAERMERRRAEVSFREPNEVFQSVNASFKDYDNIFSEAALQLPYDGADYEMIVLKDGVVIYRKKNLAWQLDRIEERLYGYSRDYIASITWVDHENVELPIEIVIVRLQERESVRVGHFRIDPEN